MRNDKWNFEQKTPAGSEGYPRSARYGQASPVFMPPTLRCFVRGCCLVCVLSVLATGSGVYAQEKIREIYVPEDQIDAVLEGAKDRVLIDRAEYDTMYEKVRKIEAERRIAERKTPAPVDAIILASDFTVSLIDRRAVYRGTVEIESLVDHPIAVPLSCGNLRLLSARWGEHPALLDPGKFVLLVPEKGRKTLTLQLLGPLQTDSTRQMIDFALPRAPRETLALEASGDVELKSGAAVIRRDVLGEGSDRKTRFDLLLDSHAAAGRLVLSLNSHKTGQLKTVLARSVQFDEVAETYERLHATLSLDIPHQGIATFRVAVPEGFEITDAHSPQLKKWTLSDSGSLELEFRESQTGKVPLTLSAIRTEFNPIGKKWTLPRFEPLDVESHAAMLGLLLDTRLNLGELTASGLIPVELRTLTAAIPPTVFDTTPGAPTLRGIAAWYAPCGAGEATSTFQSPVAEIDVDSDFRLSLAQDRQMLNGRLTLTPRGRRAFEAEIAVPQTCRLVALSDAHGNTIPFEPVPETPSAPDAANAASQPARFKIRFPEALALDQPFVLNLEATVHTENWLNAWEEIRIDYPRPRLTVPPAASETGSLAVLAAGERDYDITVDSAERVFRPNEGESDAQALPGFVTALRYADPDPSVRILVRKSVPRARAEAVSFCRFESAMLRLRYEIAWHVGEARTDSLRFTLPKELTAIPRIGGLDGLVIKEYFSTEKEDGREYDVRLALPVRGILRLGIDTQIPLPHSSGNGDGSPASVLPEPVEIALPLPRAEGVAWQSDLVAVEGDEELDLRVLNTEEPSGQNEVPVQGPVLATNPKRATPTGARSVDVGELDACSYKPGKRLLGVWRPVPGSKPLAVTLRRNETYGLAGSVIDRIHADASLGEGGRAIVRTTYALRTKPVLLEVALGADDRLWSITLDGEPFKPQRNGNSLLVDIPAKGDRQERTLEVLFDAHAALAGRQPTDGATLRLPELRLAAGETATPLPVAQTVWTVAPPSGFRVVRLGDRRIDAGVKDPALFRLLREFFHCVTEIRFAREAARRVQTELGVASIPVPMYAYNRYDYSGREAEGLKESSRWDEVRSEELADVANSQWEDIEKSKKHIRAESPFTSVPQAEGAEPSDSSVSAGWSGLDASGRRSVKISEVQPRGRRLQIAQPVSIALRQSATNTPGAESLTTVGNRGVGTLDVSLRRAAYLPFSLGVAFWGTVLLGVAGFRQASARRWKTLFAVLVAATVLVLVPGLEPLAPVFDRIAGAGLTVVLPLYLAVGFAAWLYGWWVSRTARRARAANPSQSQPAEPVAVAPVFIPSRFLIFALTVLFILLFVLAFSLFARAAHGAEDAPSPPIRLPDDAVVIPYEPSATPEKKLPTVAELLDPKRKILVPLRQWERMLRTVDPVSPENEKTVPVFGPAVACSGLEYEAVLGTEERLTVRGRADFTCRDEKPILLALPHEGGVFVEATVDGRAAVLGERGLVLAGKGKHEVRFTLQFTVKRQGGWRFVQGVLPSAPACAVRLTLPETGTDLLTENPLDRRTWTSTKDNETVETSTDAAGRFRWSWRTKISEAEIDHALKVRSEATFDVQEDGYRLTWRSDLAIGRGRQEMFRFLLPAEYTVLAVRGENVRGFSERAGADGGKDRAAKQIDVELLKPAEGTERVTLVLFKPFAVYETLAQDAESARKVLEEPVPAIDVLGAALQQGRMTVKRSTLLDVRATPEQGLQLTDLPESGTNKDATSQEDGGASPFERVLLQSYRFTDVAYRLRVEVRRVSDSPSLYIRSILRLSEQGMRLESRLTVSGKKRCDFQIRLPDRFTVEKISLPVPFEWSVIAKEDGSYLHVYPTEGWSGSTPLLLEGPVAVEPGEPLSPRGVAVPDWRHPGMSTLQNIAVLSDPAYDVHCDDPDKSLYGVDFRAAELYRMNDAAQQHLVRCTLQMSRDKSDRKEITARLRLEPRKSSVWCDSINNVRPVEDAIEETILLDYRITRAGIRSVRFDLPVWLADAKIETPLLRRKTVTPLPPAKEGDASPGVRIELELQESVMGQLRVLIAGDRPIKAGEKQTVLPPFLHETGIGRQYIVFEQGGSLDQLAVLPPTDPQGRRGAVKIARGEGEWGYLATVLGENMSEAYLVPGGPRKSIAPDDPGRLAYEMIRRETVKLSDAQIGLAETVLAVGESGEWRMEQVYRINNETQQYLDVLLPENAAIWSAWIYTAGEWERRGNEPDAAVRARLGQPVRPCTMPESRIDAYRKSARAPVRAALVGMAANDRFVRIPIVKTELGDLDYVLRLVCAGETDALASFGKREMPGLAVLNIRVDQQTMRLFLPERFDYWFDGSYRRDRQHFTAVQSYYDEFQGRRLEQAMLQQENPYARMRAYRNAVDLGEKLSGSGAVAQVEQIKQRLQQPGPTSMLGRQTSDKGFSSEIVDRRGRPGMLAQANQAPLRGIPAQQAAVSGAADADGLVFHGNRAQLESQFLSQRNDYATNVVTRSESNWKTEPGMVSKGKVDASEAGEGKKQEDKPVSTDAKGMIRGEWLASNSLTVDPDFQKITQVDEFSFVGDDAERDESEPRNVAEAIDQVVRTPYPAKELGMEMGGQGNITFHENAAIAAGSTIGFVQGDALTYNGNITSGYSGSTQVRGGAVYARTLDVSGQIRKSGEGTLSAFGVHGALGAASGNEETSMAGGGIYLSGGVIGSGAMGRRGSDIGMGGVGMGGGFGGSMQTPQPQSTRAVTNFNGKMEFPETSQAVGKPLADQAPQPASSKRELSVSQGQLVFNGVPEVLGENKESEESQSEVRNGRVEDVRRLSPRSSIVAGTSVERETSSPAPASAPVPEADETADGKPDRPQITVPPMRTHFASLDLDIPLAGREYTFSSTGPMDLSARCVEPGMGQRLSGLVWAAILFGLVYLLVRCVRRTRTRTEPVA